MQIVTQKNMIKIFLGSSVGSSAKLLILMSLVRSQPEEFGCHFSSTVEPYFCKVEVVGSNPTGGFGEYTQAVNEGTL